MNDLKVKMRDAAIFAEDRLRCFDIIDFCIFAMSFLSIGYLMGAAKRKFKKTFAPFFAFIGIISTAYVVIKIFFKDSVLYTKLRG